MSYRVVSTLLLLACGHGITRACGESTVFIPTIAVPFDRSSFASGPGFEIGIEPIGFGRATSNSRDAAMSSSDPVEVEVEPSAHIREQGGNESSVGTVRELFNALGLEEERPPAEEQEARAAGTARTHEPAAWHYPEYAYPPHDYWQPAPAYHPYHPYVPPPPPPPPQKPPAVPLLPKPAAIAPLPKPSVGAKLPGLLGLIQSLLGGLKTSGSGVGAVTGLLGGVLKPLLESKQNLKSLIGKLSVPLIVLLMVNLELLALTWWLWEDCPAAAPAPPAAPALHPAPAAHPAYYYRSAAPAPSHTFYR